VQVNRLVLQATPETLDEGKALSRQAPLPSMLILVSFASSSLVKARSSHCRFLALI
jgi:hypothetical protein